MGQRGREQRARLRQRLRIEVVQARIDDHQRRPVVGQALGANFILLGKPEGAETFAIARVVMALPGDRNAARRGRNLKQDDAALGSDQFVDFAETDSRVSVLRNLVLEPVQAFALLPVVGADNRATCYRLRK